MVFKYFPHFINLDWRKLLAHEIYNPNPDINSFTHNENNLKVLDETFELLYLRVFSFYYYYLIILAW